MKDMRYLLVAITIAFLFLMPGNGNVFAADPSQILQISIDDGVVPDLGLSLNKFQSSIQTQYEPYSVQFTYDDQDAGYTGFMKLILIFYSDYETGKIWLDYERNQLEVSIVRNEEDRIISRDNATDRYALLYAYIPEVDPHNHIQGTIIFLNGNTMTKIEATLNADKYSEQQLQDMLNKLEEKAHELLSMKAMNHQLQGQITGFGIPLRHIKVTLLDGENATEKTTDANGYFQYTGMFTKGSTYILTVNFSYAINQTTYFSLRFRENSPDAVTLDREFTYSSDSDLKQDMQMEKELPLYYGEDWAKTFASMYVHFTEALEFFTKYASVDLNFQLPLDIYTFVPKSIGTRYWYDTPGKSYITIESNMSIHESIYRPMNREYHEFCHYVMHALYRKWPAPALDLPVTIEERNHDGYLNPSTSDSYVEGFAAFMSAVIMQGYEEVGTTIPMIPPNEKDMSRFAAMNYRDNTQWIGQEYNALAWDNRGRAEESAVAGVLWDLFDDSTYYCYKTPAEMYQLYQQMLPQIQQIYEEYKADIEEDNREYGRNDTPEPFVLATLQDFENDKYDDDNATLGFEAVWDVIKTFHNDFTSVYNDFISKYPAQKKAIDEVFITHAFYADTNPGNGAYDRNDAYRDENHNRQHDAGEYFVDYPIGEFHYTVGDVIGQATNYNRLWRKSVQELPGYFIKVDNTVPFYLVKVSFPNNFYLDYLVRVWNDNGLINIPVPPEGYVSLVTVIPEGVQSSVPLSFASDVFHRHYNTSLSQGYYVEHDFQITGPIPSLPSMPGDTNSNDGSNVKQTPGFEVIMFLEHACLYLFF
ncbi:MAG: hypothetical protein MUO73_07050 [Thermoplasmata archaeon]|nr:hypothetical protein [Thermoplasmata archaeon]